mgnify:CR=1
MGKIILNGEERTVEDNEPIVDAIEEMGVPIGCSNGVCGTCEVEIISGSEHLNPINEEEEDLGMTDNRRLGCQLHITNNGTVEMTF